MSQNLNYEFSEDDFKLAHDSNDKLMDKNFVATSYAKDVWTNFKKNKGALIAAVIIVLITIMAIIGPGLNEHTFKSIITEHANLVPRIPGLEKLGIFDGMRNGENQYVAKGFQDVYYWFGTDALGRDLFTRVWSGTRISLMIALVAVLIDVCIGMIYGLISGFFGGAVDMIMQRIAEILNGIPTLVIVVLFGLVLKPGVTSIIFALMITGWIGMERITRAQVLKVKEQEYVLAAKTLGAKDFYIIFKEILPNTMGQVIILAMMSVPSAIFTESFLSFVGLGIPAPLASLGSLISTGFQNILTYPYQVAIPVVIFSALMISFNLTADGLRDAIDPKMWQ